MKVTSDQVLAWRMRRQFLDPRGDGGVEEIVGRLCGVQAQVASAAETAVAVRRNEPDPDGVKRGLADGALVRTWAMRGTLHVVRSGEVANYLSLLAAARTWTKPAWSRAFGATPQEVERLAEAVAELLDGRALTRDELVTELVADERFVAMEEQLRSGWGALLKPLAWQGVMCHGPYRDGKAVFAAPGDLVPGWKGLPEPDEAAPEAIAAYLGAFGPARPEDFDAWLSRNSLRRTLVRGWFGDMGDRLTEVDLDGGTAYVPAEHADDLADAQPGGTVRLVGPFDQYVLGPGTKDTRMLPGGHRAKVSRAAGWISPVVLLGGRIVGVWEQADEAVAVTLFADADRPKNEDLEAEAAHIARARGLTGLTVRVA